MAETKRRVRKERLDAAEGHLECLPSRLTWDGTGDKKARVAGRLH